LKISKPCSINISQTIVPHDAVRARPVLSKVLDYEGPLTVVKIANSRTLTIVALFSSIKPQKIYTIYTKYFA